MRLVREYCGFRFSAEVLREAAAVLFAGVEGKPAHELRVEVDQGTWYHDSEEEFFADYRRAFGGFSYDTSVAGHSLRVEAFPQGNRDVYVSVRAPSRDRVHEVFSVFERNLDSSRLPEPPEEPEAAPVIFIGHGRSSAWRDLKDHLQDKHGFDVEAYEVGARAGHAVRDILQGMLRRSSSALLVMTGEDETAQGKVRARQNVVHEAGLFQGRLGFSRAIVLLEEGTESFSNIEGIEQVRFSRGNIKETFGEVLATLRREFGTRAS